MTYDEYVAKYGAPTWYNRRNAEDLIRIKENNIKWCVNFTWDAFDMLVFCKTRQQARDYASVLNKGVQYWDIKVSKCIP